MTMVSTRHFAEHLGGGDCWTWKLQGMRWVGRATTRRWRRRKVGHNSWVDPTVLPSACRNVLSAPCLRDIANLRLPSWPPDPGPGRQTPPSDGWPPCPPGAGICPTAPCLGVYKHSASTPFPPGRQHQGASPVSLPSWRRGLASNLRQQVGLPEWHCTVHPTDTTINSGTAQYGTIQQQ